MKDCLVIYNPNSGHSNKREFLSKIREILTSSGYAATFFATEYPGHATEIIKNLTEIELVISIGGDGTFNEVMTGNLARPQDERLVLAHLPAGTTNDIGTMWGYGHNMYDNLNALLEGSIKDVDICTINGHPFVYVAGFGKFLNVPYDTPREQKIKFGYLAYLANGIKELFSKTNLYDLTYEINGEKHTGLYTFATITNATRVAGFNNIFKDVKLDDNQFEVLFSNISKRGDLIRTLQLVMADDKTKVPGFYFHRGNKMTITFNTPPKKPWCIDGEKFDSKVTKYDIEIVRHVKIKMPKKNLKINFKEE